MADLSLIGQHHTPSAISCHLDEKNNDFIRLQVTQLKAKVINTGLSEAKQLFNVLYYILLGHPINQGPLIRLIAPFNLLFSFSCLRFSKYHYLDALYIFK